MTAPEMTTTERLVIVGAEASPYAPESLVRQITDAWAGCDFTGGRADWTEMAQVAIDVAAGRWTP